MMIYRYFISHITKSGGVSKTCNTVCNFSKPIRTRKDIDELVATIKKDNPMEEEVMLLSFSQLEGID